MGLNGRRAEPTRSRFETVLHDFARAWDDGENPRAEAWLDRLDPDAPAEATELIYQEYCLAEAAGLAPDGDDYFRRFPEHRASLFRLFELHAIGTTDDAENWNVPSSLPEPGDDIGPFSLVRLLGEGSFARVFLARETDLDQRYVVVKVTTRPSAEPNLLARARHAHIVEVIRHATADDGALQVISMPFLGGATLGAVLASGDRRPRSGADLLARLDRVAAPEYPAADVPRPAREILTKLSYPRAIAWIFARLAEALDHAHRRGIAHGDLKPSNILITADGLPMLFDFNLSVDWRDAEVSEAGGGTLAYMPPERLQALADARAGRPVATSPDLHRADIYAMGLVLVEALTGHPPFVAKPSSRNPAADLAIARGSGALPDAVLRSIPAGLRPILKLCLAIDPAARYRDGRSLAEDLDRWRLDQPPIHAPESPWPGPMLRWSRRNRTILAASVLTMVVAVVATDIAASGFRSTVHDHAEAKYLQHLEKDDTGFFAFRPFDSWTELPGDPADQAERKLNIYHVLDEPGWRDRDDFAALSEPSRADVELLMLEQVYRIATAWADRPDSPDDWRRALALLDRESRHAPNPSFDALQGQLRTKLGGTEPDPIAARPATPAWITAYLAGVASEPLHAREAFRQYHEACSLRPDLLWPHYRVSVVACRLAYYKTAIQHLRTASARYPGSPALLIHLASIFLLEAKPLDALDACERALEIDPDFPEAYATWILVADSLAKGDATTSRRSRFALLTRYRSRAEVDKLDLRSLLQRYPGQQDEANARRDAMVRKILTLDPSNPDFRVLEANQMARSGNPDGAIAAFDAIIEGNPEHLRARYNQILWLRKLNKPEATPKIEELVQHPRFEELFREDRQAISLMHMLTNDRIKEGRYDQAVEIAERGLRQSRAASLMEGESLYVLARALAAAAGSDTDRLDLAREHARQAIALVPGLRVWYEREIDFARLRKIGPIDEPFAARETLANSAQKPTSRPLDNR